MQVQLQKSESGPALSGDVTRMISVMRASPARRLVQGRHGPGREQSGANPMNKRNSGTPSRLGANAEREKIHCKLHTLCDPVSGPDNRAELKQDQHDKKNRTAAHAN